MAVVTISRQFGAGARTLGEMIAQKMGFDLVDEFILEEVARLANVSLDWVNQVEREAGDRLLQVIHGIVSSGLGYRLPKESGAGFDREKYVAFVTRVVTDLADRGGCVIIGRGGQFILKDHPRALRVLLVADRPVRVNFLMTRYGVSQDEAEKMIARNEKVRNNLYNTFFKAGNPDDPLAYHLTVNTGLISLEQAQKMICNLLGQFIDRESRPIW